MRILRRHPLLETRAAIEALEPRRLLSGSLSGQTLSVEYDYPTIGSALSGRGTNPQTLTVDGSGVSALLSNPTVTVNATSTTLTENGFRDYSSYPDEAGFSANTFNGLVFTQTGGEAPFTSVSVDPSTTISGIVATFDATHIYLNQSGLLYSASSQVVLDYTVGTSTLTPLFKGKLPAEVISSQKARFTNTLRVTDTSGAAVKGKASASILLSPDTSAADSVLTIGSGSAKINLKAGKSASVPLKFITTIPSSVPADDYHVLVELTDTNGAVNTFDTGRILPVVSPTVDLMGSFVKTPTSVKAGKPFTFTIEVGNSAASTISAVGKLPIDIEISADGNPADATVQTNKDPAVNLKPGHSMKFTYTATLATPGHIVIDLDPGNTVFPDDINPSNNVFVSILVQTN